MFFQGNRFRTSLCKCFWFRVFKRWKKLTLLNRCTSKETKLLWSELKEENGRSYLGWDQESIPLFPINLSNNSNLRRASWCFIHSTNGCVKWYFNFFFIETEDYFLIDIDYACKKTPVWFRVLVQRLPFLLIDGQTNIFTEDLSEMPQTNWALTFVGASAFSKRCFIRLNLGTITSMLTMSFIRFAIKKDRLTETIFLLRTVIPMRVRQITLDLYTDFNTKR